MDQFTLNTENTGASHHQSGERRCNDGELQDLSDTQQKEASLPHLWHTVFLVTPEKTLHITHTKVTHTQIHAYKCKNTQNKNTSVHKDSYTDGGFFSPPVTSTVPPNFPLSPNNTYPFPRSRNELLSACSVSTLACLSLHWHPVHHSPQLHCHREKELCSLTFKYISRLTPCS